MKWGYNFYVVCRGDIFKGVIGKYLSIFVFLNVWEKDYVFGGWYRMVIFDCRI